MKLLFVHQNFPGQFQHLAPAIAANPANQVLALTMRKDVPNLHPRLRIARYATKRGTSKQIHPWVADFETKVIRAEAAMQAAVAMKKQGFTPDVVVAHPGWGESLFLRDVWPQVKLGIYSEFYYSADGDTAFDPEFPTADYVVEASRLRIKNANNALHFEIANGGLSPTKWQRSTFPEPFRSRITVAHDGVDTDRLAPLASARFELPGGGTLTREDEVITFVNRNLEPYRGYHVFMRALPELMARRPKAHVVVVGGDDVSYGARPPEGKTWKQIFLDEVADRIDHGRLHFVGHLPYPNFVSLLQVATVHVYLTYPFVLSWSLIEAMSVGCAIVASRTQPLLEAIEHGERGLLVDFFDIAAFADAVATLAADPDRRHRMGEQARAFACRTYDLRRVCLPAQARWVQQLAGS